MKRNECEGQSAYVAHRVDSQVIDFMRECFKQIKLTPRDVALESKFKAHMTEIKKQIKIQRSAAPEAMLPPYTAAPPVPAVENAAVRMGRSLSPAYVSKAVSSPCIILKTKNNNLFTFTSPSSEKI